MSSKRPDVACCFCGERMPKFGPEVFTLNMGEPAGGPRVVLAWHLRRGCAEADPLHIEIADATALPDGREGDDLIAGAYLRLLDRIGSQRGAEGLRAAIDIRRDIGSLTVTLRGPGRSWGRRSLR